MSARLRAALLALATVGATTALPRCSQRVSAAEPPRVVAAPAAASQPAAPLLRPVPAAAVVAPERARAVGATRAAIDDVVAEMEAPRRGAKGKTARPPGEVAVVARSLASGERIAERHGSRLQKGASNVKLFTTAAALLRLGADHRFETKFSSDAPLGDDGVLEGDLWAIGGGDPTLAGEWIEGGARAAFHRVADSLAERGIRRVRGSLVLDDRLFVDKPYHPLWPAEDRGKPHALDVGALVVEHDRITIEARAEGGQVALACTPTAAGWRVENAVKIAGGPSSITAHARDGVVRVSGSVADGRTARTSFGTLEPARLFGATLREVFAERGIQFGGDPRPPAPGERAPANVWLRLASAAPLAEVVAVTNRESDNLLAEMILKALGARRRGEGSFAAGVAAVRDAIAEIGVPTDGYAAVDGSGLSHQSKLTASATVALLDAMARTPLADAFRNSLATGGDPRGTLRSRFRDAGLSGRLRAKTGSLDGATALSGYVDTTSGETIAFSILTQYEEKGGASFKPDEDRIVRALAELRAR
ncbi:MAG TPA: D-alanyl-D-alanine carboxypeptidase/D-alanyl-D-alanine-endopeptidase [Planctomycetota bacterium]|nr:D-alanyl-D-alanine carboxypeptidase/D-alanyl-D-alanine-endopeptidase [Planctomycetota bacterium]